MVGRFKQNVISEVSTATLCPVSELMVVPDSNVNFHTWRRCNALDVPDLSHYRINHSEIFADKHNHINGIENI